MMGESWFKESRREGVREGKRVWMMLLQLSVAGLGT